MTRAINAEISATWRYHEATKHSYASVRSHQGGLDWANRPRPFKIYPALDPFPLPREFPAADAEALHSGQSIPSSLPQGEAPALEQLAALLHFSAGITRRRIYAGGELYFHAAACTGALYEIELYLVAAQIDRLPAGVYHFSPADFALRRLRSGDWRGVLVAAAAAEPAVARAPISIISTGTYWRNAWKYGARTYRHFGWDNGTILANLLAMAAAHRLQPRLVLGFQDAPVNRLLDLDEGKEVALSIVALGDSDPAPETDPEIPALGLEVIPPSRREVDFPAMRAMHAATRLAGAAEVASWRGALPAAPQQEVAGAVVALGPAQDAPAGPALEAVIARRGSTRRFARKPITLAELAASLDRATGVIPADFLDPPGAPLNDIYLIANAVVGLEPGSYALHRRPLRLELLRRGSFRQEARHLALDQDLAGDAAADVFFLADLNRILGRFGNRGYRAAQLEAGILGGRLYLAAYAQQFGATGLTFYDDEVVEFFSPHAAGRSAIFLIALGRSAERLPLARE
ncbi:MAG TPA: SagB/ThcOx family dehydrogenase [Candidatus Acidoferrales bacterium]|nr:SagB/ThcOx family dehydrogenase [Candidatus Acidoferrales bacterium]